MNTQLLIEEILDRLAVLSLKAAMACNTESPESTMQVYDAHKMKSKFAGIIADCFDGVQPRSSTNKDLEAFYAELVQKTPYYG